MNRKIFPSYKQINSLVMDFDGVFTNNIVYTDQNGNESVSCNRSDGLGFNMLERFLKIKNYKINYFILSTEKNPVVMKRAEKLNIKCYQGINSKLDFIKNYLNKRFGEDIFSREGVVYLGNDLNDIKAMKYCGYKVCPNDAHNHVKEISNLILKSNGGEGCLRELIEILLSHWGFDKERLLELV